ncbi:hypothetical protein J437_LFUL001519 [Ladona fulva]|uniref:Uncharacterized protein n=1 Tax=Ladona fulva TaxID=123851 RepID=A0A8K0K0P9_LADFU|nr:hypothetical protein J437_LFUL001519 [Ladona fulva]
MLLRHHPSWRRPLRYDKYIKALAAVTVIIGTCIGNVGSRSITPALFQQLTQEGKAREKDGQVRCDRGAFFGPVLRPMFGGRNSSLRSSEIRTGEHARLPPSHVSQRLPDDSHQL